MAAGKMHADEQDIGVPLVRRLIARQFPQWAELSIAPLATAGTDNAIFRLGDEMAVRLPRIADATGQVEKELRWLPRLAPRLPLTIPTPLAKGLPGEGYPWEWCVHRWIAGENATVAQVADPLVFATDLARFITGLWRIDLKEWPPDELPQSSRGVPLHTRDVYVRNAIAALAGKLDTRAVTAAWEAAVAVPEWDGPPVMLHGDLQPLNLLVERGRLHAVIDFGALSVGDPAADVMTAWLALTADTREAFRTALAVDGATWARARGWALSVGLIALPYYEQTNPALASIARHAIREVLADHQNQG